MDELPQHRTVRSRGTGGNEVSRLVRVLITIAFVLALGAGIGFVVSRPSSTDGTVSHGQQLPALTTVPFAPETMFVPAALPTTTTTTKPTKQPVKFVTKNSTKNVTKNVTRQTTISKP